MAFMKTRDELLQLSISQLVELALDLESEAEQLRARLAELAGVDDPQSLPIMPDEISEIAALPIPHEDKHARHRHRSWYERIRRKLFAKNKPSRTHLVTALVIVGITILIGLYFGVYYGVGVSSGVIER